MATWREGARNTYTSLRIDATDFVDAGDVVTMTVHVTGRGAASRITMGAEITYVLRCRDGQLISATTFAARREALESVGLEA